MLTPGAETLELGPILAHFEEHGWARVGRVLSDGALRQLGERLDDLMMARVRHEGMFFQLDSATGRYGDLEFAKGWQGPSPNYRKLEKLELDPIFATWIANPLFERIARARIAGPIAIYRAVVFNKSRSGGTELPWHQDGGAFWGIDRDPELQIWTALDDCTIDAGCVELLPGTHRAGLTTKEGGVIPDALLREAEAERRAVAIPARAGEVLLIHNHVWHRSRLNRSDHRRAALTICYMSAATRCLRRKRAPRQFPVVFP